MYLHIHIHIHIHKHIHIHVHLRVEHGCTWIAPHCHPRRNDIRHVERDSSWVRPWFPHRMSSNRHVDRATPHDIRHVERDRYGMATISRLLKIIGLLEKEPYKRDMCCSTFHDGTTNEATNLCTPTRRVYIPCSLHIEWKSKQSMYIISRVCAALSALLVCIYSGLNIFCQFH